MGWTENIHKILPKEDIISADYKRLCKEDEDFDENISTRRMLNSIKKKLQMDVRSDDYDLKYYGDKTYRTVKLKQFYRFLLHEREGTIKEKYLSRKQEKYEYNRRFKHLKDSLPDEKDIYSKKYEWGGKQVELKRARGSRVPYITYKEGRKTIREPLPSEWRREERKNPILYSSRLFLFYLCDQGKYNFPKHHCIT